jgi:trehalose/maltose hydrolase-like predicted phosphorylase
MYDWNLEIDEDACTQGREKNEKGAFIGNGKIGMFAEFSGCGLQQCMISGEFKKNHGMFTSNTIDTFRTSEWKLFRNSTDNTSVRPISQRLNMKSGILTSENEYTDGETGHRVHVSSDIYAARQLPYCVIQTLRISSDVDTLLFHDVSSSDKMQSVDFVYSMIDTDANSSITTPLSMLVGRGFVDGVDVCFASCVVFENADDHNVLGFNRYSNESGKSYVKMRVKASSAPIKLHCITVHMTSFDFPNPYDECKMVILSILSKPLLLSLNVVQRIREDHVAQWAKIWKFDIHINKTLDDDEFADKTNMIMKKNLYMIFSCTRDNLAIEVNPSTFGVIDSTNSSIYDGDMFLIPLLLYAMPNAARALLEYRYKQLASAIQVAASYGYSGAKFPYNTDILGYRNALYWDSLSPMYLFNNAMIALNVWNYYRVTIDREWLMNKGYNILKYCADFFVSRSTVDSNGVYHLDNVMAFNRAEEPSNDNAFTNNLVKLSLKAVIEASHDLGYPVKKEWHDMFVKLPINISNGGLETYEVVLFDSKSTSSSVITEVYNIVEQLFILTPMMSELYMVPGTRRGYESIKRNLDFYVNRVSGAYVSHPINTMLISSVYSVCNKYNNTHVSDFKDYLETLYADQNSTVWGQQTDITIAAILPLVFINSVAGVNIQGGVSESKFYYDEMTIKGLYATNMPPNWESITVSNCGAYKKSFKVYNQNV